MVITKPTDSWSTTLFSVGGSSSTEERRLLLRLSLVASTAILRGFGRPVLGSVDNWSCSNYEPVLHTAL